MKGSASEPGLSSFVYSVQSSNSFLVGHRQFRYSVTQNEPTNRQDLYTSYIKEFIVNFSMAQALSLESLRSDHDE